jgi:hypothetical protein
MKNKFVEFGGSQRGEASVKILSLGLLGVVCIYLNGQAKMRLAHQRELAVMLRALPESGG